MVHPDKCKHPQSKEAFGGMFKMLFLLDKERYCLPLQWSSADVQIFVNGIIGL